MGNLNRAVGLSIITHLLLISELNRNRSEEDEERQQQARREGREVPEDENKRKSGLLWRILGIVCG